MLLKPMRNDLLGFATESSFLSHHLHGIGKCRQKECRQKECRQNQTVPPQ